MSDAPTPEITARQWLDLEQQWGEPWGDPGHCHNLLDAFAERVIELEASNDEYDHVLRRQSELLTGVANAIKGPPGPRHAHDWSDLPARASELRVRVDRLGGFGDELRRIWTELQ